SIFLVQRLKFEAFIDLNTGSWIRDRLPKKKQRRRIGGGGARLARGFSAARYGHVHNGQ
ncbi:hypothetical protein J6590_104353, partial [Homalodisca vitripennis]